MSTGTPTPTTAHNTPGRSCPADYALDQMLFENTNDSCDLLFVVGGLYGNPFALYVMQHLHARASATGARVLTVFNGDVHWFDKNADNFARIESAVRQTPGFVLLSGNVEAELISDRAAAIGCGCSYPASVPDAAVARSNVIHSMLKEELAARPDLTGPLRTRPRSYVVEIGGARVAAVHGDEKSLAGWGCSREDLAGPARQEEVASWMRRYSFSVLATTHTCAPAVLSTGAGLVINNGAAGLPNFKGHHAGLVTLVAPACSPYLDKLDLPHYDAAAGADPNGRASRADADAPEASILKEFAVPVPLKSADDTTTSGLTVALVNLNYDHAAYVKWFDHLWDSESPAAISYRARITDGTSDRFDGSFTGSCSA